jgi:hypothetical protein
MAIACSWSKPSRGIVSAKPARNCSGENSLRYAAL